MSRRKRREPAADARYQSPAMPAAKPVGRPRRRFPQEVLALVLAELRSRGWTLDETQVGYRVAMARRGPHDPWTQFYTNDTGTTFAVSNGDWRRVCDLAEGFVT